MTQKNDESDYALLKVQAVADRFGMSTKWVYDHWAELGGSKIGGTLFFTEEGLRNSLIQKTQRQNKVMPHKKRGLRIGKRRETKAERDRIAAAKRHGLIDIDGEIL